MGHPISSAFSRGGSLLPSSYADARCIDDVIVSKVTTVVNDVAEWHQAATFVDPAVVDNVTPMLLPGEEVIASLPMVAALGFPKFRDNRVGHGHVVLTKTTRAVIVDKIKTDEFHRRLIFMIAGKHQAFGGVEHASNNTALKQSFITCLPGGRCPWGTPCWSVKAHNGPTRTILCFASINHCPPPSFVVSEASPQCPLEQMAVLSSVC